MVYSRHPNKQISASVINPPPMRRIPAVPDMWGGGVGVIPVRGKTGERKVSLTVRGGITLFDMIDSLENPPPPHPPTTTTCRKWKCRRNYNFSNKLADRL